VDLPAWLASRSPLFLVGWSAVAAVVVCWLTVSFSAAKVTKLRAGWVGATAMYVALCSLFLSGFLGAERMIGKVAFGFLFALFSVGFLIACQRTLRALAGKAGGKVESATH
jgi:hypothetical protein